MIKGVMSFLGGLQWLLQKNELRAVLWRIAALLLVLMTLLGFGVFALADWLIGLWIPEGDAWYWQLLTWLLTALAMFLALLVGVVSFTLMGSIAVAPWLDMLAVRAGRIAGQDMQENADSWGKQMARSVANAILPLTSLLLAGVLVLLVVWIPVLGQLAATVIWTLATVMFLNYELMDTHASRQGLKFGQRKAILKQRRFYWLGFGGLAMLLMMVPVVNLLVIPAAVVGLSRNQDWLSIEG